MPWGSGVQNRELGTVSGAGMGPVRESIQDKLEMAMPGRLGQEGTMTDSRGDRGDRCDGVVEARDSKTDDRVELDQCVEAMWATQERVLKD